MDSLPIPPLRSALAPKEFFTLDSFRDGDLIHLLAEVARRPAGTVLPVLGQNACYDAQGNLWRLLAYVPASPEECTTYAGRQASRFPEAGQLERWFGGVHMRFTEIDITDSAESLALERCTEAVVIPMYPANQLGRPALRKAA
jgi:hypothetical protein